MSFDAISTLASHVCAATELAQAAKVGSTQTWTDNAYVPVVQPQAQPQVR